MGGLLAAMKDWAQDDVYVQRAAVAGLCEPALLRNNSDAVEVLAILVGITRSLAASTNRSDDGFRVLRQALGYGWSVAAAAAPANAIPYLQKWMRATDKDVMWVMKSNLAKNRMADLREKLAVRPGPARRSGSRAK